jgi:transcriptional regulator with PAS, ATPase and Fis domain
LGGAVVKRGFYELRDFSFTLGRASGPHCICLEDPSVSRMHAEVQLNDDGLLSVADRGSRNGTFVNGQPIQQSSIDGPAVLRLGDCLLVHTQITVPPLAGDFAPTGEWSLSWSLSTHLADIAARARLPVLIQGPTGAGKEILAQRIHAGSGRTGPLCPLNCGAISAELIASELFGHEAGAFSGAKGHREGLFVSAHRGTVFLDEVGELPLEQQPALLRVLQEGTVRPVGSDRERPVDVRVVAATHRGLFDLVEEGRFRRDLYYRLAGFDVGVDGLAGRKDDVLRLFDRFSEGLPLAPDAAEALLLHDWPGNVRELKALAEKLRLVAGAGPVLPAHLPDAFHRRSARSEARTPRREAEPTAEELIALLQRHRGNVASVGRDLGKHRQQVYRWLRKFGLDATQYR